MSVRTELRQDRNGRLFRMAECNGCRRWVTGDAGRVWWHRTDRTGPWCRGSGEPIESNPALEAERAAIFARPA